MIDEFNNDCPYDFKNIQFLRKLDVDKYFDEDEGEDVYCYTFSSFDADEEVVDSSCTYYCHDNIIKNYSVDGILIPNNNVFLSEESCVGIYCDIDCVYISVKGVNIKYERFEDYCSNIIISSAGNNKFSYSSDIICDNWHNIIEGCIFNSYCYSITISTPLSSIVFDSGIENETIDESPLWGSHIGYNSNDELVIYNPADVAQPISNNE